MSSNPYAPKYYIRVTYANGFSQYVTAGNANPPKRATFSDSDIKGSIARMREVARKNRTGLEFNEELID